jgi:hypothetical protein
MTSREDSSANSRYEFTSAASQEYASAGPIAHTLAEDGCTQSAANGLGGSKHIIGEFEFQEVREMTRVTKIGSGLALVLSSTAIPAQDCFDFVRVPGIDAPPLVDIKLSGAQLRGDAFAPEAVDPEVVRVLSKLRTVCARAYRPVDDANQVDGMAQDLEDAGWRRAVFAKDDGADVRIYVQWTGEWSGIRIIEVGDSAVVFTNIDGTFSAADLGKLMTDLGIPGVRGAITLPPGTGIDARPKAQSGGDSRPSATP